VHLFDKSIEYISGLFSVERHKRNLERIVEKTKSNYQSMQQFITNSPWSAQAVMNTVAKKVNQDLGDPLYQSLNIDENSHHKSGTSSVGVSRQYNGNLGKIDNCQTAVFATLGRDSLVCQINAKLYLPKEWIEDKARCQKAGIPAKEIKYKSKVELALQIIKEADTNGIKYGWIGADSLYGQGYEFANQLDLMGKKYVLDIKKNQYVYLEEPLIDKIGKTKEDKFEITNGVSPKKVEDIYTSLKNKDFTLVGWRKGTKGLLKALFCVQKVWVWDKESEKAKERTLLIRRDENRVKYSISNFTVEEKTIEEFAYMQGQRYWIERCFQDNINELGMTDYQIRKYTAWYHHMALVMMAMHYILKKRIEFKQSIPLLSTRDIRLQMIEQLINQGVRMEEEIVQMIRRHLQRKEDIDRYYQNKKPPKFQP
jgi:SRSO17 transposase